MSSPNNNANINSDGDGNAGRRVCLEFHPAVEVFVTGGLPSTCPVFENPILEDSSTNRHWPSLQNHFPEQTILAHTCTYPRTSEQDL